MVNTRQKIVLSVVLFSLVATVTTGGFSIFYILGIMKDNTHEYLSENANSYGHELNGIIIGIEVTVDSIVKSVIGVVDEEKTGDPNYFYELSEELESIITQFDENSVNAMSVYVRFDPEISYGTAGVFHADTDGDGMLETLIPTDINIYDRDDRERVGWFYEPIDAGKPIWTAPYYNANIDIDMISYISPIILGDKIIGVVGVDINFDQLKGITNRRDKVGSVIITDQNHHFLVHPLYSIEDRIDTIDDGKLGYLIDVLEKEKYGTVKYVLASDEKVLGYATLKNDWAVVVALSEKEAFTNLNRVVLILLIINVLITFVMILFATFIAKYLNTLISRNSELEHMVDERTKELVSTNEYLKVSMAELEESKGELTILNDQLETTLIQVREMQDKVVMSEKLASLGELVTSVAHELNTPLGICITTNSYILAEIDAIKTSYETGKISKKALANCIEESIKAVSITEKSLKQMANLIDAFKQVTLDKSMIDIKKINIKDYLLKIISEYKQNEGGHTIEVECSDEFEIVTYPTVIKQLFKQLINNSMIHGFEDEKSRHIFIKVSRRGSEIEIKYTDDGKGIAKNISKKVFEPFYTTKKNKGNAGLGMHIIYNLVSTTLDGTLEFNSHEGEGVEFVITFNAIDLEYKRY